MEHTHAELLMNLEVAQLMLKSSKQVSAMGIEPQIQQFNTDTHKNSWDILVCGS